MPMCNLIEHSDNYSKTSGSLWNYYRDEPFLNANGAIADFSADDNNSASFELKVGLSPSKKICVICLIESPLKMIKNAFYFILKALFVLKIFKLFSRLFGHAGKTA